MYMYSEDKQTSVSCVYPEEEGDEGEGEGEEGE